MPFPEGLQTKTLTFGRYTSALGNSRGGTIHVGFDKSMLHIPTGEVIVGGVDAVEINRDTGVRSIEVPITVTDALLADWRETQPYSNQRLRVDIDVEGYKQETLYLDINYLDPPVIDFDQMQKYPSAGGMPVTRAAVATLAGLTGDITAENAAAVLQPYLATGTLTEAQYDQLTEDIQIDLEPPIDLVLLFQNAKT